MQHDMSSGFTDQQKNLDIKQGTSLDKHDDAMPITGGVVSVIGIVNIMHITNSSVAGSSQPRHGFACPFPSLPLIDRSVALQSFDHQACLAVQGFLQQHWAALCCSGKAAAGRHA